LVEGEFFDYCHFESFSVSLARFSAETKADIQAFGSKLGEELVVKEAVIILQELSSKTDLSS